jgi:hypothetical protein
MGRRSGCFKNGCFGCLGLVVLLVIFLGVSALVAKNNLDSIQMQDRWLVATESSTENSVSAAPASSGNKFKSGRVILNLSQGEFEIKPAKPGEPLSVQAKYDSHNYFIKEDYQVLPDSTWIYRLDYHRTQSGLQSILQAILGGGQESRIVIYLPTDVPLELDFDVEQGGMESELGGLWIQDADIKVGKGGFILSVGEPLQHPMEKLKIRGSMGGIVLSKLGNASPQRLDVDWRMGGGEIDLRGQWLNDCDVRFVASMGGVDIRVPEEVRTTGLPQLDDSGLEQNQEVPLPVLRFDVDVSMGGFEAWR